MYVVQFVDTPEHPGMTALLRLLTTWPFRTKVHTGHTGPRSTDAWWSIAAYALCHDHDNNNMTMLMAMAQMTIIMTMTMITMTKTMTMKITTTITKTMIVTMIIMTMKSL